MKHYLWVVKPAGDSKWELASVGQSQITPNSTSLFGGKEQALAEALRQLNQNQRLRLINVLPIDAMIGIVFADMV